MGLRLRHRPGKILLLVQDHLDAQFLHARFQRGKVNFAIALHRMGIAGVDQRPCSALG